ncbi:gas vesicle protein GvpO [Streptosporangium sp. NPDC003464]
MPVRRSSHDRRADASDDLYDEEDERLDEDEDDDAFDDEDFDEDEPVEEIPDTRRRPRGLTAATAGRAGLRHIADLTGKAPEGVTFVQPQENGWRVGVEVVEDRRIPSSGDILALYEAEMDQEGDLLSYRRTRRYKRGRGDDG